MLYRRGMKLFDYLAEERGRAARVAAEVGLHVAFLSQIARGVRPVPADRAPALERASGGRVRRWDMRPADWHRIWPELVGSEGAPLVSGEQTVTRPERAAA